MAKPTRPGRAEPEKPRKTGRPSKIDDLILRPAGKDGKQEAIKVSDAILETIRLGNYKETAARYAGINDSTLYRWLEWGDPEREEFKDDPERQVYREFRDAVQKAEAEAETHDIAYITAAIRGTNDHPGDWKAAAWRRERMAPEKYGRRERLVLTQETTVQIALDVLELVRQVLDKHIQDVPLRQAVLADIIESGITGGASTNGAARPS